MILHKDVATITIADKAVLVFVGQNSRENHALVKEADPDDYWFHLNGHPSGHGIYTGDNPSPQAIYQMAMLVKEQSKFKNVPKVSICYTQVKNLKLMKTLGQVLLLKKPCLVKV